MCHKTLDKDKFFSILIGKEHLDLSRSNKGQLVQIFLLPLLLGRIKKAPHASAKGLRHPILALF